MVMFILLDLDLCVFDLNIRSLEKDSLIEDSTRLAMRNQFVTFNMDYPEAKDSIPMNGFIRPHLKEFLTYTSSKYRVAIWSAGTPNYVKHCVEYLFKDIEDKPLVVLTRDDIVQTDDDYHKPLYKFFERVPEANVTNTIFIDDKKSNFMMYPDNGITIPPFKYDELSPVKSILDDVALIQILQWIEDNSDAIDVRNIDKSKIFSSNVKQLDELVIDYNPVKRTPVSVRKNPNLTIKTQ
jgi:hypothetical protein